MNKQIRNIVDKIESRKLLTEKQFNLYKKYYGGKDDLKNFNEVYTSGFKYFLKYIHLLFNSFIAVIGITLLFILTPVIYPLVKFYYYIKFKRFTYKRYVKKFGDKNE
jgi:hypothetical protein